MKTSTKMITATVLSLGIVGGVAAYKGDGWHRGEHFISHVRDELDLTPEQTEALQAIRDEVWDIRQNVTQDKEAQQQALLAVIDGEIFDQGRALELVSQKTKLVEQYAPQVIVSLANFYDGLSAEQQAEVREHIAKHVTHRWQH